MSGEGDKAREFKADKELWHMSCICMLQGWERPPNFFKAFFPMLYHCFTLQETVFIPDAF